MVKNVSAMRQNGKGTANKSTTTQDRKKEELPQVGLEPRALLSRQVLYQLSYQSNTGGRGSNLTKANLKPPCYGTVYSLTSSERKVQRTQFHFNDTCGTSLYQQVCPKNTTIGPFSHNQSHVDLKFYKIQLYTKWFGYTSWHDWHDWNAISRLYLQQQLEQYELL